MIRFTLQTHVTFGQGAIAETGAELARLGIANPLLVTDPYLSRLPLVAGLIAALPKATVFADTPENPTESAAETALAVYRAKGCDGVIAVGGGSPMDLGKAVALLATHEGGLADYDLTQEGHQPVGPIAPLLVVPTTAGTGTEMGLGCVMILKDGHKAIIDSFNLIPGGVICDPDLTVGLPPRLTAATGMDALSHCIEGVFSNIDNPPAEAIALDGARRICRSLERAVATSGDIEARADMMWGSLAGGYAMLMELGAAHGISVPVGAVHHVHHGALTAAVLGRVVAVNARLAPTKAARLREAMQVPADQDLGDWIDALCLRIGLTTSLREFGLAEDELPGFAKEAVEGFFNATNPKPLTQDDYLSIMKANW
ncbi:iron-containing alcohol dehydrogenase [Mameliella alba]|nr:iron-containing alcohol dehydrogenase [Mameliella alba]MBY6169616.1 iron-containing alcohol dehydrogenase [Mameliella alba]MBY6174635.1 iron-containing alcohol dehydrogenase [Mameliella alba]